jgi:hypothetical protein
VRTIAAMAFAAGLFSSASNAEVIATCGASDGWAYYVPGGISPVKKAEWTKDGISKGSFQLIRSGEDFDVIFSDASGGTLSAKADGATVIGAATPGGDYIVHVLYAIAAETYVFWMSDKPPTVSFSQAKFAAHIPKHSLMVAACRAGA